MTLKELVAMHSVPQITSSPAPLMALALADATAFAARIEEEMRRAQDEVDLMLGQITRQYGLSSSTPPKSQLDAPIDAPDGLVNRARLIVRKRWFAWVYRISSNKDGHLLKDESTLTTKDICEWVLRSAREEGITWEACMDWYESNAIT